MSLAFQIVQKSTEVGHKPLIFVQTTFFQPLIIFSFLPQILFLHKKKDQSIVLAVLVPPCYSIVFSVSIQSYNNLKILKLSCKFDASH